jgi:hypothetical protein
MNDTELMNFLEEIEALPAAGQLERIRRLAADDIERADLIMSGERAAAGHAETPGPGGDPADDVCDTCGPLADPATVAMPVYHPIIVLDRMM